MLNVREDEQQNSEGVVTFFISKLCDLIKPHSLAVFSRGKRRQLYSGAIQIYN